MSVINVVVWCFFFFKQKTAYEMRISDWSSDVCSSDLDWTAFQQARSELGASFVRILGYFHEDGVKSVAAIEDAMRRADSAALVLPAHTLKGERSEERRVGKECVSTCRSRWSPYH